MRTRLAPSTTRRRPGHGRCGLVALIVVASAATAAPVHDPPKPGDGALPRLSTLLWSHVGPNPFVGCDVVSVSLQAHAGSVQGNRVNVFWMRARQPLDFERIARDKKGERRPSLPDAPGSPALKAQLEALPAPSSWWLARPPTGPELTTMRLVDPRLAVTTAAVWGYPPAGSLPWVALHLADRIALLKGDKDVDLVFSRWEEEALRAGLSSISCRLIVKLRRPGHELSVEWQASQHPSPRMRSYTSKNGPDLPPGHFTVTVEDGREFVRASTFLMPYSIVVTGPPGTKDSTNQLLMDLLGSVFGR